MRTYETVFILNPEFGADAQAEQINFYKENITSNGGEILAVENWGKLTLAYKIEKFTEGVYVLIQFNAPNDYIPELEKRFKFNEDVIRYVVVMVDEKKFKLKPKKEVARKERKPRSAESQSEEFDEAAENFSENGAPETIETTEE